VIRRLFIGGGIALVVAALALWLLLPKPQYEQAYVRGRNVTAWNRVAQVREPVVVLRHGELVSVLERRGTHASVRTSEGRVGWVDERQLMEPDLWRQGAQLLDRTRGMVAYATGRTKVVSNIRAEPGRAGPRIFQLTAGVPVEVVARAVAAWSPQDTTSTTEEGGAEKQTRREDWSLVRARDREVGEIAGWVLGRFIEPDLPAPLHNLGAGIRWMGWYELGHVSDEGIEKPQFLGLGITGPEGQACDFNLMRVFTWHTVRDRYETAYVDSSLCGSLPVSVVRQDAETLFSFENIGLGGKEQREYRFRQNIVRRIRSGSR